MVNQIICYVFYAICPFIIISIFLQNANAQKKEYYLSRFEEDVRFSNFLIDGGLGRWIATGDVNGDGINDILAGSDHIKKLRLAAGGAYLFFGKQELSRFNDLENPNGRVLFLSNVEQDAAGDYVDVFDFTGDGLADVFIAAPQILRGQNNQGAGKIYFLQGRTDWPYEIILENYPTDSFSATIHGERPNAHLGSPIVHGDFNGDGIDDLATISRFANREAPPTQQGTVYIVWGGQELISAPIDSSAIHQCTIIPPDEKQIGMLVFAKNLDEDKFDDLFIMLTDATVENVDRAGSGFILWGRDIWPKKIDLRNWQALENITRILEHREVAHAFTSHAIGDFDGSGTRDMAITSFVGSGYRPGFVQIYLDPVFRGKKVFSLDDPSHKSVVIADRHLKSHDFPYILASLDWNNDGIDDLAISNPGTLILNGIVYVVFGNAVLPDTINFVTNNAEYSWIRYGDEKYDSAYLGMGLAGADINADQKDDLIIGAWTATTKKGGDSSGEVYVFFNRDTKSDLPIPDEVNLLPVMPNPVQANTVIFFDLPEQLSIKLEIYDILGRKVRTLREGVLGPGRYSAIWNAKDDAATDLASGVYFAVLRANQILYKQKLLLIH